MAVSRAEIVERNFLSHLESRHGRGGQTPESLERAIRPGSALSVRQTLELFTFQLESRVLDLLARELKREGASYYTIGSAGHEGNACVAAALNTDDMAFLHYRSGAFFCARAGLTPGPEGPFDVLLGIVASSDEPIAGGRHKVFGSVPLCIPPQTSTIASHLPKALGYAVALDRKARIEEREETRIAVCTFGDASLNHATAQSAMHSAAWASFQNVPAPVLFVCEDNGFGISVRTPRNWVESTYTDRAGLKLFRSNGLDLVEAYDVARAAADYVRTHRKPALLHMSVVRLLGHAGSDVERLYREQSEIEATEAMDPLIRAADILMDEGGLSAETLLTLYQSIRTRLGALAQEATVRDKITSREEVMVPLAPKNPQAVAARAQQSASAEERTTYHRNRLPEDDARKRHLAFQLNRGLADLFMQYPEAVLFGEDVARKGGVYHVTAELSKRFGVARVFNTLLDETTILGLAMGAGHAKLLPFPEVQYLAYLMNAIDQLRGEAGSMQFFSQAQYGNPMVLRIAALAYQKGFGGHFHNDNGIAALLEIPGLLVACPSRGDDAVRMLRTLTATAKELGRPTVFLEPIALYMTKDLHEEGDGEWLTAYPGTEEHLPVGEIGVYEPANGKAQLTILSFANGLWMSLRVAKRLEAEGIHARVVDIRWLSPLPIESILSVVAPGDNVLVVDECRRNSGIADALATRLFMNCPGVRVGLVTGTDSYIPLGAAANLVLVQEEDIEAGVHELLGRS